MPTAFRFDPLATELHKLASVIEVAFVPCLSAISVRYVFTSGVRELYNATAMAHFDMSPKPSPLSHASVGQKPDRTESELGGQR